MQVVNVSVKNIRPIHSNLKEWVESKDNLYVGRGGIVFINGERYPKEDSPFCNPFRIGRDGTREDVLRKYREMLASNPALITAFLEAARDKKYLGCWCKPDTCHADILAEIMVNRGK